MSKISDRLLENPVTSLIGLVLIGVSILLAFQEMKEGLQMLLVSGLLTAGLIALGLEDKDVTDDDE